MTQCEQNPNEDRLQAFMKMYEQYDGFIQSVIRFSAKNRTDQEDIYQEVYIALYAKKDWEGVQDLKSYLYRLIVNKANEFLRSKITRQIRHKEYLESALDDMIQDRVQGQNLLVFEQMDDMIDLIRSCLSEKESEAILLRFKDHYGIDEAAEKMKVQKKTLIRYVSVGLKKLREIIKSMRRAE